MRTILTIWIVTLTLINSPLSIAQELSAVQETAFHKASDALTKQLADSVAELNDLRERIAAEKVPLSRKLNELENELSKIRLDYQQVSRLLDSRTLDLSNLRTEIASRQQEATYLTNLLSEYVRNFESRLHIAEIQRYDEILPKAKLAVENSGLAREDIYRVQADLLSASIDRLEDALGGTRFSGSAVDPEGLVKPGTFILIGPCALFLSDEGKTIGTAEQRLGSLEPTVIPFGTVDDALAASQVVTQSVGPFPLDPTLGNAHKIEQTRETLWEHILKGGPVMAPILILASAALLVALFKWLSLILLRKPSPRQIADLLSAVARRDISAIRQTAKTMRGPVGKMLSAGVEHIRQPRELIEEVMFETVLSTRLKVQSMLPFVALSASSAPLLGLLGTVTGIINTFKLITVYGSGDIKTLSAGISEALITTEFGLYVAIPSLLLYAFLSRKARRVVDQMEKTAVVFVNQVSKYPFDPHPMPVGNSV